MDRSELVKKYNVRALRDKLSVLKNISWKSPKVIGGSIALVLLLGSGIVYLNATTSAVCVAVNGEKLGLVASKKQAVEMVEQILAEKGAPLGVEAKTHDDITYSFVRTKNIDYSPISKEELAEDISGYVDGVKLIVDSKPIFVLANSEDGEKLLKEYEEFYTKPGKNNQISSVKYDETIDMQPVEVSPENALSYEESLEKLKQGDSKKIEYTIQEEDSWWLIARKNNMMTKEVLACNPGTNENTVLTPGKTIYLEKREPYITVISEGVRTETETIPYDVVKKSDSSLQCGESKVIQAGNNGHKEVQYAYVQKNGEIVSQTVKDETIVTEAVPQVVANGPKREAVTVAYSRGKAGTVSGLGWPLVGRINSYYGHRSSGFHTGIDINGNTGVPYVAAAAGKVVSAGWSGRYGYAIVIDHGNGVSTRYAHSSKLYVSSGQTVSKGQRIGLVGSTGNSTGPHLHFEVIVNGNTVNPLNSLR